nr:YjcZ family sporulation protein [Neobacillus niacini]
MSDGHGHGSAFALIVVLFILLIIVYLTILKVKKAIAIMQTLRGNILSKRFCVKKYIQSKLKHINHYYRFQYLEMLK